MINIIDNNVCTFSFYSFWTMWQHLLHPFPPAPHLMPFPRLLSIPSFSLSSFHAWVTQSVFFHVQFNSVCLLSSPRLLFCPCMGYSVCLFMPLLLNLYCSFYNHNYSTCLLSMPRLLNLSSLHTQVTQSSFRALVTQTYVLFCFFILQCPNLQTQFSRKQAQNARFHLIENERFGWFSRKQGL